jgi:hypothetical protein
MMIARNRRHLFQNKSQRPTSKPRGLRCEPLEDRQLLAVVTSLANTGPGTLREALAGPDPTITFAVSGTIDLMTQLLVNRAVVIDGAGQSVTLNNIGTALASRIFNIITTNNVEIRNLTLTNGVVANNAPNAGGGAIRANGVNLTVENCTISGNQAREGGAIGLAGNADLILRNSTLMNNSTYVRGGAIAVPSGSTATIVGSTIDGNTTGVGFDAGYLSIGGGISAFGAVTVTGSIIRNNIATTVQADLGYGGGIGVVEGGQLTVEDSEISGNMSDRGGGITSRGAPVVIRGSLISGNTAPGNGGGVRVMRIPGSNGTLTIEDSTFTGNTAYGGGGVGGQPYAGSEVATSTVDIRSTTLEGNVSSFDGGALEFFGTTANLENVTISGNTATNEGGGLWNSFDSVFTGTTTLNYTTITGNTAAISGGGVWSGEPTLTMTNSILSGNMATGGVGVDLYDTMYLGGTPITASYSLVADGGGHLVLNGVMGNISGMPANLGPLMDNGGPTETHALMPGPGVDGADPASTVAVDQRGFGRPGANSSRDMGAFESDGSSPVVNLDFNNDGSYNCADMDLLEAAIDAGMPVATFDVNDDGMLTSADVFAWLMDAGEIRFGAGRFFKAGDATLDGTVDGSDFGVWNSNKFTASNRWCQGDFNQDNNVDGSDFGVWNSNKFTSSDAGRGSGSMASELRSRAADQTGRRQQGASKFQNLETMVAAFGDRDASVVLAAPRMHAPNPALRRVQPVVMPVSVPEASWQLASVEERHTKSDAVSVVRSTAAEKVRESVFGEMDDWAC